MASIPTVLDNGAFLAFTWGRLLQFLAFPDQTEALQDTTAACLLHFSHLDLSGAHSLLLLVHQVPATQSAYRLNATAHTQIPAWSIAELDNDRTMHADIKQFGTSATPVIFAHLLRDAPVRATHPDIIKADQP